MNMPKRLLKGHPIAETNGYKDQAEADLLRTAALGKATTALKHADKLTKAALAEKDSVGESNLDLSKDEQDVGTGSCNGSAMDRPEMAAGVDRINRVLGKRSPSPSDAKVATWGAFRKSNLVLGKISAKALSKVYRS